MPPDKICVDYPSWNASIYCGIDILAIYANLFLAYRPPVLTGNVIYLPD